MAKCDIQKFRNTKLKRNVEINLNNLKKGRKTMKLHFKYVIPILLLLIYLSFQSALIWSWFITYSRNSIQTCRIMKTDKLVASNPPKWIVNLSEVKNGPQKRKFAVVSIAVPNCLEVKPHFWTYVFYLPLTIEAWKRIGFDTIVIMIADNNSIQPSAERLLNHVIETSVNIGYMHVISIDIQTNLTLMMSQVLRLYTSHLAHFKKDDFILTSDVDLWPIRKERFNMDKNKKILITNSECCPKFTYKDKFYQQFPLCHIGMSAAQWRFIFPLKLKNKRKSKFERYYQYDQSDLRPILRKLEAVFGKAIYKQIKRGSPLWSVDQKYASIMIDNYRKRSGDEFIKFVTKFMCHRIDKITWEDSIRFRKCKEDAHLLRGSMWNDEEWKRLMLLTKMLFNKRTLDKFQEYRINFQKLYNTR